MNTNYLIYNLIKILQEQQSKSPTPERRYIIDQLKIIIAHSHKRGF